MSIAFPKMTLLVVIVDYRTADLTIDCLASLRDEIAAIDGARVVVVENASGDDSGEKILDSIKSNQWDDWVELKVLDRNGGFSAGNNAAIGPAMSGADAPEFVLLLNPDTIARAGSIGSLLDFMGDHPKVGIAGSRLEEPDGSVQRSAFRFPGVMSELDGGVRIGFVSKMLERWNVSPLPPAEASRVDWVAGASMMIRREVFEAIGLLDERYFMYFEEVDFCRRAAKAGWECWYVPGSRVVHMVGQSSGVTDVSQSNKPRPAYWFASRRRFFMTHCGPVRTFLADILWTAGFAMWRVRRAILNRPDNDPEGMLRDFVGYNFLGWESRSSV